MVYNYTSSSPVIAQLIRTTGMTNATYADSILEWLQEACNLMQTRKMLVPRHFCIEVEDNVGKLPCNVTMMDGLFYNGQRLRLGTGSFDQRVNLGKGTIKDLQSYFVSDQNNLGSSANEQNYLMIRGADLKQVNESSGTDYYIPCPNHIQTSFKCGKVLMLYKGMPVDAQGYPMIPDEQNFRNSVMWYIMSQLAIVGYKFPDPKFDYQFCDNEYNKYKIKAMRKLKYWSTDQKEAFMNYWVSLMPPRNYYMNFSINGEQPKPIDL